MTRKLVFLNIIAISLIILFSACAKFDDYYNVSAGEIHSQNLAFSLFQGEWQDKESGSYVRFFENKMALEGKLWDEISYKIKTVKSLDYLKTKALNDEEKIKAMIEEDSIDVITLYAFKHYLGEIVEVSSERIFFFTQNKLLELYKTNDQIDDISLLELLVDGGQSLDQNGQESGVLIGLRQTNQEDITYSSLWISSLGNNQITMLEADKIIFPRTNGFYELWIEEDQGGGNLISTKRVGTNENLEDLEIIDEIGIKKKLDYVGNDYISIELKENGLARKKVLTVDNLRSESGMKISEILPNNGQEKLMNKYKQFLEDLKSTNSIIEDNRLIIGENFGIRREKGRWILEGRINYRSENVKDYLDYDLKTPIPDKVVYYDELGISWLKIRDRIPDALDGFTSPNKDIAVIRTKNKLLVYAMDPEQLGEKPIGEISLNENSEIIMIEWATGSYVADWERIFKTFAQNLV